MHQLRPLTSGDVSGVAQLEQRETLSFVCGWFKRIFSASRVFLGGHSHMYASAVHTELYAYIEKADVLLALDTSNECCVHVYRRGCG